MVTVGGRYRFRIKCPYKGCPATFTRRAGYRQHVTMKH